MKTLTIPQVREVFRKIANGEREHGSFLTAFAQAYIAADYENEIMLLPVAVQFIDKYDITGYVEEPPDPVGSGRKRA